MYIVFILTILHFLKLTYARAAGGNSLWIEGTPNSLGKAFEGQRNLSADFKNGKKLQSHFDDHGVDFGYTTVDDCLAGARNFVMKDPTSTTQSFISKEGTYFRYDTKTNEFAIVNQYGGISTYYKPVDGLKYWNEQVNLYKPK